MSTHTLQVSRDGVLRSLRNQFTRNTTFLSELLQNARRAGASAIWVQWSHADQTLIVCDDGSGIENFDALFTVGRSGWDLGVIARENPFGVGFVAAVFASEHIRIRTLQKEASFDTRALLDFEPIEAHTIENAPTHGTEIALRLQRDILPKTLTAEEALDTGLHTYWRDILSSLVKGFPIPVHFEGESLPRPHALKGDLTFFPTEVGYLYPLGCSDGEFPLRIELPRAYCQGLPISLNHREWPIDNLRNRDVLHLDDRIDVRMPDRDIVLDSINFNRQIHLAQTGLWKKLLLELQGLLPRDRFVDRYWRHSVSLGLPELLTDAPLAASMVRRYVQPVSFDEDAEVLADWTATLPERPHHPFILPLDPSGQECEGGHPVPLASVYAAVAGIPVLDESVPDCHWARPGVLNLLDEELGLRYRPNGVTRTGQLNAEWVTCMVLVCESTTIDLNPTATCEVDPQLLAQLPAVTTDRFAFYDPKASRLVVPAGVFSLHELLLQVTNYRDSDTEHFHDVDLERDAQLLHNLVACLRSDSPLDYLDSLLRHLTPDGDLLGNATYTVRYDFTQRRLVVATT